MTTKNEIGYAQYFKQDKDISWLPFLNKQWKVWAFIFLIFNIIFFITMTTLLISAQTSGCENYDAKKLLRDKIQDDINVLLDQNKTCENTISSFDKVITTLKEQKYFDSTSTSGSYNTTQPTTGFTNIIVTGFKGFGDFAISGYDLNFIFTKKDTLDAINLDVKTFADNFLMQTSELNRSQRLYDSLKSNIETEKGKTQNLEDLKTKSQNNRDNIKSNVDSTSLLKDKNTSMITSLLNDGNSKIYVDELNVQKTNLNKQRVDLINQKNILNNKKITQDNLVLSLTKTNTDLSNKIKTKNINCALYK